MYIIRISFDADPEDVFAALQHVGEPWRPAFDIPRLVFMDGGSEELISAVPGIAWCCYDDKIDANWSRPRPLEAVR